MKMSGAFLVVIALAAWGYLGHLDFQDAIIFDASICPCPTDGTKYEFDCYCRGQ